MPNKKKKNSFEESINELEALVNALETGELSLEESLSTFEKGIKLTKACQLQLNQAKQKVSLLIGEGENIHLVDYEDGNTT
ncbi:exodeoxyribonuclease VII small subunit [Candidatus Endobugula sertula]|uniref:Exodeoxyribonuclease 7 small subunit n=1 Tax=Candidatus Endobugula sertula TaxID=62101 RepID=A0A1D2QMN5_9GAMM|nr:exodeoxyribonuclease VII small subunit [Candidatus Endobugula sertula]